MMKDTHRDNASPPSNEQVRTIASRFDLREPLEVSDFPEKGNINQQTYLVAAGAPQDRSEFILQLLNPDVFTQPRIVMNAMIACIQAQQKALASGALENSEEWETIRLVPTREGNPCLELMDENRLCCWRMMLRIRRAHTYKSLREIPDPALRLRVAEEAGKGLALFGFLTADMDPSRIDYPLPGYRDTGLYFDQLHSILEGCRIPMEASVYLPADSVVRQCTERYFLVAQDPEEYRRRLEDPQVRRIIALALEQKSFAHTLIKGLADGSLQKTVIHGDTKLDNFLFSNATGKVKAFVDLDTIMPHTWLSDWGDMVRSLVNLAGEKETDPGKIEVDIETFKAIAKGFWGAARRIPQPEIELMTDAPQIMALELGVRFLTDYLRGDNYFRLKPEDPRDLNKTRAIVQFRLFEMLRRNESLLKRIVAELTRKPSSDS